MNCKPGDLAVVVRSRGGNLGRLVVCLRLATDADFKKHRVCNDIVAWVVDQPMKIIGREDSIPMAPDEFLRPIRDHGDDAIDETLQFLPAPSEETA